MEESGKVFYRFGRNSICSTLSIEKMREICSRHPHLNTKFTNFVNRTISQVTKKQEPKPYPLDYIMNTPSHLKQPDNKDQEVADRLENILKNIVVRELTKIRAKKAKPTLKESVDEYLIKKGEKDERARIRIKEQVLQIYEQKTFE